MMAFLVVIATGAAAALYCLSAVAHLSLMFRREYAFLARWSTRIAWLVQSAGLVMLVAEQGRPPVYSLFEASHLLVWLLMTNYVVLEFLRDNQAAGSFLTPVIAAVMVLSLALPKSGVEPHLGEHPTKLIVWHVGVTLLGYAFFIGSFVAGALYLIQDRNLRRKHFGPIYYALPSLESLDIWAGRLVYLGFPLLTLGVGAGLTFAHVTWETFWQLDAKVIFTVFVWLAYGGYLLMRKVWGWGGRRAAWWVVAAGVALLFNYFVINLASNVHRFGV
jgi:ABC-type transport system involved in cytochrome c biogenesis permease subunit